MSEEIKRTSVDDPAHGSDVEAKSVTIDPAPSAPAYDADAAYQRALAALESTSEIDQSQAPSPAAPEMQAVATDEVRSVSLEGEPAQGGDATPPQPQEQSTESEDRKQTEQIDVPDEPGDNVEQPAEPDSERWAALYERDRQLQQQAAQVKRQLEEAKAEGERLRAQQEQWQKQVTALQAIQEGRALDGLKDLGIEYSELTRQVLQAGDQPANLEPLKQEMNAQMEELKGQIEAMKAEKARVEAQAVRAKELEIVRSQVEGAGEKYELLRSFVPDYHERIHAAVYHAWEEAGRPENMPLTPTQIADNMEAALVERLTSAKQAKKLQELFGHTAPAAAPEPSKPVESAQRQRATTLTNQHASAVDRTPEYVSDEDCRKRALALLDS